MSERVVMVTGGAGYIGSHVCKALHTAGYLPVVFDNLSTGHINAIKWGPFFRGDITDVGMLRKAFEYYAPYAVIHCAARAYVAESMSNPSRYYKNNLTGSISLFEVMLLTGVHKVVFSSSCAVYGIPSKLPVCEKQSVNPVSPYGWSKLVAEVILRDYARAYNLRSVSLRYFNAAGADLDGEIGESHDPETHLIPRVLTACENSDTQITIFGDNYSTRDGTCIRDYVHVSDLAEGHVIALKYLENSVNTSRVFNLGLGIGFSNLDIVRAAERVTKRRCQISFSSPRPGDPPELIADTSLARSELGWKPQILDIDLMLDSAWKWMKSTSN